MNSSRRYGRALPDAVRRALRHVGCRLSQLLYLSNARDCQTGRYGDPVLLLDFDEAELDAELGRQHRKSFADWLALPLEEQYTELLEYLGDSPLSQVLLQQVRLPQWYERLIPPDAMVPERELFFCNFDALVAIIDGTAAAGISFQQERRTAGQENQSIINGEHQTASQVLRLANELAGKIVGRVIWKEYVARLCHRGRIKPGPYFAELNKLRITEGLGTSRSKL